MKKRLSRRYSDLLELVEACNRAAEARRDTQVRDEAIVNFAGVVSSASPTAIASIAALDAFRHKINVYFSSEHPQVVVRLISERPSKFVRKLISTISKASNRQFSGERPGIIWIHIDHLSPGVFSSMAVGKNGRSSLFDLIALAIFDSEKRSHIAQLIFSGGARLTKNGDHMRSDFESVVYNSPNDKFSEVTLFHGGKQRIKNEGMPPRTPISRALLEEAAVTVGVAHGSGVEANPMYDLLIRSTSKLPLRELVMASFLRQGDELASQNRKSDALAAYDKVVAQCETSDPDVALYGYTTTALIQKAAVLCELERKVEVISSYDDLLSRFGNASHPLLEEQVANALYNKGVVLGELGRSEDEIAAYDEILTRWIATTEEPIGEHVASALANKAGALRGLGRCAEAITICDVLLARFGSSSEMALCEPVAIALLNKADALRELGKSKEAIAVCESICVKFGSSTSGPSLRDIVVEAKTLLDTLRGAKEHL
jgi:tetratricopeptide (TPR) repeat protein